MEGKYWESVGKNWFGNAEKRHTMLSSTCEDGAVDIDVVSSTFADGTGC